MFEIDHTSIFGSAETFGGDQQRPAVPVIDPPISQMTDGPRKILLPRRPGESRFAPPPATSYIVANATNVFSDHSFYGTKVMGELKRGEHVDVLAKVKGWEWVLVGKNGTGIGYVSISMLSPADKYIP